MTLFSQLGVLEGREGELVYLRDTRGLVIRTQEGWTEVKVTHFYEILH